MFDLRRSRAVVVTLLSLAAAVAVLNAALGATLGEPSRWFPPDEDTYDWLFLERSASQFAAARREAGPVGVVIGLSSSAFAVNPDLLAEEGPPGYRWMITNGFGGTAHKHAEFARLLAASGLRPGVVIFAINPLVLSERQPPGAAQAGGGPAPRRSLREAVRDHLWIVQSRFHAKHLLRRAALSFKIALLARLGSDTGAAVAPSSTPWEPIEMKLDGRMTPETADLTREKYRSSGFFVPERYAPDSSRCRELVAGVRAARSTGARVLVVLLPEITEMRRTMPAPAYRLAGEALAAAFGPEAPPVLDLTAAVPDGDFLDFIHTNRQGNAIFTSTLGRRLRQILR